MTRFSVAENIALVEQVAGPNLEELAHGLRCTLCSRTWTVPAESSDVQLATVGEWFEQHQCKPEVRAREDAS